MANSFSLVTMVPPTRSTVAAAGPGAGGARAEPARRRGLGAERGLALTLLASRTHVFTIGFHYAATIVPALFAVTPAVARAHVPRLRMGPRRGFVASGSLFPHVALRRAIYPMPDYRRAEWVLARRAAPGERPNLRLRRLLRHPKFEKVAEHAGDSVAFAVDEVAAAAHGAGVLFEGMARRDDAHIATNVTTPSAPLVGREGELARVREQLDEGRLLTLLGAGGMGKTRLALELGASVARSYGAAGGVWFVDLTNVRTQESFLAAVAHVLGAPVAGEGSLESRAAQIGDQLRSRGATVVILDNFEQLDVGCATHVERWVQEAAHVRVLVTSRGRLEIPSEQVLALGPLSTEAATELFVRRMRGLDTFDDDDERAVVTRIVEAVDRMPLAIELAASRTSVLSLEELEARLEEPLEVLRAAGSPDGRHGSVERAVRDSVELLAEPERRFFLLLSVFGDGARTADIEAVLGSLALGVASPLDALDRLGRISLLRSDRTGSVARHSLFRTIREVADALAAAEALVPKARAAHMTHYARSARRWALEREALHHGDVENLLVAHGHAVASGAASDACALAVALEPALGAHGRVRDALSALDATLELLTEGAVVPGDAAAAVRVARGRALQDVGQTAEAKAEALAALDEADDPIRCAEAWLLLGALDDVTGDTAGARDRFEHALERLENGDGADPREQKRLRVMAQRLTGHAHRREGSLDEALRLTTASVVGARELGDRPAEAAALYEKGVVELFRGDREATLATFVEGLAVAEAAGLPVMAGAMMTARACLLQELGRYDEALRGHSDAARLFEQSGSRHREGSALYYLGTTYLDRGEPSAALPVLERARGRLAPVQAVRYDALVSSAMALSHGTLDDTERAEAEMRRAEEALARVANEPALEVAVALRRRALEAMTGADADLTAARALVARHGTDDTRASLRLLERAAEGRAGPDRAALVVWTDGSAFRAPDEAEPGSLPEGSPLRGILVCLARTRIESPAEWVPVEGLIAAGWSGEKMGAEAGLNRLYVALTALRKKGLRPFLERGPGGYALTPAVPVRWAAPGRLGPD